MEKLTEDTSGAPAPPARTVRRATIGGHNPALDGLRALAVLTVLFHHMDLVPGGYLGVDLFLVLSGFLITGLLLAERDREGWISLRAFWARRGFRLLPAFYIFVAAGIPLVLLVKDTDDQWQFLRNGLAAVFYVANIQRTLNPPDSGAWFGHVWTLSLEEQFYLLWPIALVLICRSERWRRRLPEILISAVILVLIWREILIGSGVANFRIYYAPDTRCDSLLVGCLLATWRYEALRSSAGGRVLDGDLSRATGRTAQLLSRAASFGPLGLLGLVILFFTGPGLKGDPNWMARGGYLLVAVLASVAVLGADQHRPGWYDRVLSSRPAAWVGRISYSLYLWHFPVTGVANDSLVPRFGRVPSAGAALVVSLGLASASYYLVERPVQRRRPAWVNARGTAPRRARTSIVAPSAEPLLATTQPLAVSGEPEPARRLRS
ncbi:acyltransferase family protein [Parafrankia discariae]|uniref:acyltransferase family protein n=1 Tax=Parafrankia discariae TaxID=365528 RepID=UPI0004760961|nr:acyltransferase [Parafrankia discariae]